jgi:hypothetical protein
MAFCMGFGCPQAPKEVPFEKLVAGPHYLRETQPENVVIRSKADETKFIENHQFAALTPNFPTVDYAKNLVLGVILGPQTTGAIRVNVTRIEEYQDCLKVYSVRTLPNPKSFVTSDIGYPVSLVQIPQTKKRIDFCPTQDETRKAP